MPIKHSNTNTLRIDLWGFAYHRCYCPYLFRAGWPNYSSQIIISDETVSLKPEAIRESRPNNQPKDERNARRLPLACAPHVASKLDAEGSAPALVSADKGTPFFFRNSARFLWRRNRSSTSFTSDPRTSGTPSCARPCMLMPELIWPASHPRRQGPSSLKGAWRPELELQSPAGCRYSPPKWRR